MWYFFAAYVQAKRDVQIGSQVGRQTANMLVCLWNVFELCVCVFMSVCQCLREKAFESACLLPGGKAFISYLQAQTGALIFSHIFLTPLCSSTPEGHYSVPYRSDYLRKQCCEVKTLWSQAGNAEPEKPSLIVDFPQIKTQLNLDNWVMMQYSFVAEFMNFSQNISFKNPLKWVIYDFFCAWNWR